MTTDSFLFRVVVPILNFLALGLLVAATGKTEEYRALGMLISNGGVALAHRVFGVNLIITVWKRR